jgi:hypothetical protein
MELFMCICIKALEFITILITGFTEEKVIAILAHPATFVYQLFAVKALVFLLLVELGFEHCLELMTWPMGLGTVHTFMSGSFEETFLTYFIK